MSKAPPSFDFYPSDFVDAVRLWSSCEIGAYVMLLCWQWRHGFIPESDQDRRLVAQVDDAKVWERMWAEKLRFKFDPYEYRNVIDHDPVNSEEQLKRRVLANERMHGDRNDYLPRWKHNKEVYKSNGKRGGRPRKKRVQNQSGYEIETKAVSENSANSKPLWEGEGEGGGSSDPRKKGQPNAHALKEEAFETLWKIWPSHKRKRDKGKARAAFQKYAKVERLEEILETTVRYLESPVATEEDRQFLRGVLTWCNGPGWDDDPEVWQRSRESTQIDPEAV